MKTISILIIGLLSTFFCYSQTDSIKIENIQIKSHLIESEFKTEINNQQFKIDSIDITITRFDNKIKVINRFSDSKSVLNINYYFDSKNLILITIQEPSPYFPEYEMYSYSAFYFDDNKLFKEKYRHTISGHIAGIGIPRDKDKYELFGYNRSFTNDFLKNYAILLYKKIKITE